MARKVTDPHDVDWKVAREWAPWRPRLRRRDRDGDGSGWLDLGDLFSVDDAGGLLVAIGLAIFVVALFLVVWPVVAIAIELVLVALGILVAAAGRILLRRPWTVSAVTAGGRRWRWQVVGWGESGRLVEEIAEAIRLGGALPPGRVA